jgi:hypothetical protein
VEPLVINSPSHEDHESLCLMRRRSQQSEDLVPDALVSQSVTSTHVRPDILHLLFTHMSDA